MTSKQEETPELHLLTIPEVFVYKIPPITNASRILAQDWNLEKPALTGQLRVVSRGEKVYIQIFQIPENTALLPQLFGSCPIQLEESGPKSKLEFFFQGVSDSSRYFVLRLQDEKSGRHAYIGIGFQERQSAFDLRAAVDDELKKIQRGEHLLDEEALEAANQGPIPPPSVDRSLKEGQTIKVNIKVAGAKKSKSSSSGGSSSLKLKPPGGGGGGLGLAPPPSAPTRTVNKVGSTTATAAPPAAPPPVQQTTNSLIDTMGELSLLDPLASSLSAMTTTTTTTTKSDDFDWGDFQS